MNSLRLTTQSSFFHPSSHNIVTKDKLFYNKRFISTTYQWKFVAEGMRTCILCPKVPFPLARNGFASAWLGKFLLGKMLFRTRGRMRLSSEPVGIPRRVAFQGIGCSLWIVDFKLYCNISKCDNALEDSISYLHPENLLLRLVATNRAARQDHWWRWWHFQCFFCLQSTFLPIYYR